MSDVVEATATKAPVVNGSKDVGAVIAEHQETITKLIGDYHSGTVDPFEVVRLVGEMGLPPEVINTFLGNILNAPKPAAPKPAAKPVAAPVQSQAPAPAQTQTRGVPTGKAPVGFFAEPVQPRPPSRPQHGLENALNDVGADMIPALDHYIPGAVLHIQLGVSYPLQDDGAPSNDPDESWPLALIQVSDSAQLGDAYKALITNAMQAFEEALKESK